MNKRDLLKNELCDFEEFEKYISHEELLNLLNQCEINFEITKKGDEKVFNCSEYHNKKLYFNMDNLYLFKDEESIENKDNDFIQFENYYLQVDDKYKVDDLFYFIAKKIESVSDIKSYEDFSYKEVLISIPIAIMIVSIIILGLVTFEGNMAEPTENMPLIVIIMITGSITFYHFAAKAMKRRKKKQYALKAYKNYKFINFGECASIIIEQEVINIKSLEKMGKDIEERVINTIDSHIRYKKIKMNKTI